MTHLNEFFRQVIEFVFPPYCIVCDGRLNPSDKLVCLTCRTELKYVDGVVSEGVVDYDCIDEIRAGVYYDERLQTLIHYFKYQRALALADTFASILESLIKEHKMWREADLLIPVPLHKIKLRERSFNQSEEVAKALSIKVSIPCDSKVLFRRVNTVSQTQMSGAQERIKNMSGVFAVRKNNILNGKTIILVDDLITTGSTANACARVLKEHGAKKVLVLTVGRPFFDLKISKELLQLGSTA